MKNHNEKPQNAVVEHGYAITLPNGIVPYKYVGPKVKGFLSISNKCFLFLFLGCHYYDDGRSKLSKKLSTRNTVNCKMLCRVV